VNNLPEVRFEYNPATKTITIHKDASGGGCCGENRRDWELVATVNAVTFVGLLQDSVGKGRPKGFTMYQVPEL
jgi:hypothetical protein